MSEDTKIFTDQPVQFDEQAFFGFSKYSKILAKAIIATLTPITFGVFGGWGTGKTSLMQMIYNRIIENSENASEKDKLKKNVFPIWFDAWRYENEPNLLIPLLYTMRDEIRLRHPNGQASNPFVKLANFLDDFVISLVAGVELNLKTDSYGIAYKIKDSIEESRARKRIRKEWVGASASFDLFIHLREVVANLNPIKIVIFVDDLDRCQPEKALQMLEYIKLVMNFEGIAFVVGADREILEKVVLAKFAESFRVDGHAFIKKMFQVIFTLPELREEDIQRYVENLIADSHSVDERNLGSVSRIIVRGAGANPREIKRLVNSFTIMTDLESNNNSPEKRAMFLVLQQKWPNIYRRIAENKEAFIQFCSELNKNKKVASEIVKSHESMRLLGINEDLLQYFISIPDSMSFLNAKELDEYFHSASVTSYQPLLRHELKFIHSSRLTEKGGKSGPYEWKLHPVASDTTLNRIEKIRYRLPADTYPDYDRATTAENRFTIQGVGSSNIPIGITIYFHSGESVEQSYFLDLGSLS